MIESFYFLSFDDKLFFKLSSDLESTPKLKRKYEMMTNSYYDNHYDNNNNFSFVREKRNGINFLVEIYKRSSDAIKKHNNNNDNFVFLSCVKILEPFVNEIRESFLDNFSFDTYRELDKKYFGVDGSVLRKSFGNPAKNEIIYSDKFSHLIDSNYCVTDHGLMTMNLEAICL